MPVLRLPPARWRLPAVSSIALAVLFFGFALSQLASAAELECSNIHRDHNHHRLGGLVASEVDWGASLESSLYEAQFSVADRSLVGRAETTIPLTNDVLTQATVAAGQLQYFVFTNTSVWSAPSNSTSLPSVPPNSGVITKRSDLDSLEFDDELDGHLLLKRQATGSRTVYISVNVCNQPSLNGSANSAVQPMLYVSTTSQTPGPGQSLANPPVPFVEGFANVSISTTGSVFIGLASPNVSVSQAWTYTISASIDNYFQNAVSNGTFTFLVDTDSTSALVSTYQLWAADPNTDNSTLFNQWMKFNSSPPFTMLVFKDNVSMSGLSQSYCALSKMQDSSIKISTSLTNRNVGNLLKQQFFIENLEPGQSYYAVLAYLGSDPAAPSGTIGGGGQVWQPLKFTTNSGMLL
jgi:calcium channel MID1